MAEHASPEATDRDAGPPMRQRRSLVYSPKRRQQQVQTGDSSSLAGRETVICALLTVLYRYGFTRPVVCVAADTFRLVSPVIAHTDDAETILAAVDDAVARATPLSPDRILELGSQIGESGFDSENPLFRVAFDVSVARDELRQLKTDVIVSWDSDDRVLRIDCNDRLYSPESMERFAHHVARHIEWITSDTTVPLADAPLLSPAEHEQLGTFGTGSKFEGNFVSVSALFERRLSELPDDPCVRCGGRDFSYTEVHARAGAIAARLKDRGANRGQILGLCLRPGIAQLSALLAVFRIGATVLPVDYSLPPRRLRQVLGLAQPHLTICDAGTAQLCSQTGATLLDLDDDTRRAEQPELDGVPIRAGDDAYVLFTSGSTGIPKGVRMSHAALANLVSWQTRRAPAAHAHRTLQRTSIAFDVGFQEIFSTWASGGCLVVLNDDERADILRLPQIIEKHAISRLFLPPVALRQLAHAYDSRRHDLQTVSEICVAGEQLRIDRAIVRMARDAGISLDNQYGPTETHVVSAARLSDSPMRWPALPPIGSPIDNCCIELLDPFGRRVPPGVTGEIRVSGVPVANGYLESTEPGDTGFRTDGTVRSYRTGDFGFWDESGSLHFVGRRDDQVKIKGYRVEPGEIESRLLAMDAVNAAVVTVYADGSGASQLAAYLTPQDLDPESIRRQLRDVLPEYMVPLSSSIVCLSDFPLTSTGKIDKRRLPAPIPQEASGVAASGDTIADSVSAMLASELGLKSIPPGERFIDRGGDSLRAIQALLVIEAKYGVALPLRQILTGTAQTIAAEIEAILDARRQREPGANAGTTASETRLLPNGISIRQIFSEETDYLYQDIFVHRTYEQCGIRFPATGIIVDIGANIGLFALYARSRSPDSHIVAVEPAPPAFEALFANLARTPGTNTPLNYAVSDRTGTATLTYYPFVSGMSSLYPNVDHEASLLRAIVEEQQGQPISDDRLTDLVRDRFQSRQFEVELITLPKLFQLLSIDRIGLLKIDIQKSEIDVLLGLDADGWRKIEQLVLEVHDFDGAADRTVSLLKERDYAVTVRPHPLHPSSVVRMIYALRQ